MPRHWLKLPEGLPENPLTVGGARIMLARPEYWPAGRGYRSRIAVMGHVPCLSYEPTYYEAPFLSPPQLLA